MGVCASTAATSRPSHALDQDGPARPRSAPASSKSTSSPTSRGRPAVTSDWTGDTDFATGPGLDLFIETARYWVSRIRLDRSGDAHIYGVIGPDEYHEPVDDNAFTNVMARWNLRRAPSCGRSRP